MRWRIWSKLIFASCVWYFDRAYDGLCMASCRKYRPYVRRKTNLKLQNSRSGWVYIWEIFVIFEVARTVRSLSRVFHVKFNQVRVRASFARCIAVWYILLVYASCSLPGTLAPISTYKFYKIKKQQLRDGGFGRNSSLPPVCDTSIGRTTGFIWPHAGITARIVRVQGGTRNLKLDVSITYQYKPTTYNIRRAFPPFFHLNYVSVKALCA